MRNRWAFSIRRAALSSPRPRRRLEYPTRETLEDRTLLSVSEIISNLTAPAGVAIDSQGHLFVSYLDESNILSGVEPILGEYTSSGTPLATFSLPGGIGSLVALGTSASSLNPDLLPNDLLELTNGGEIYAIRPSTGKVLPWINLDETPIDNSSIYDAASGVTHSFGGTILPFESNYGDIAVYNNEIFLTGVSGGIPFVSRLVLQSGQVQSDKVIASSTATVLGITTPRGVAVNAGGLVVTTLPVPVDGVPDDGEDVPVAFLASYPEGKGSGIAVDTTAVASRGMTTDSDGNFVIATGPTGTSLGGTSGGVVLLSSAGEYGFLPLSTDSTLSSQDVAAMSDQGSAGDVDVYVVVTDINFSGEGGVLFSYYQPSREFPAPTPAPGPTPTSTPAPTPSPTPTTNHEPTPTATPAPTPSPAPTTTYEPTPTATPAPTPPQLAEVTPVGHLNKGLAAISLVFDEALNPNAASNPGLFSVNGAVEKRGKTVYTKRVAVRSVSYNSAAKTVTINLAKPYKGVLQVTVHAGLVAANGAASRGDVSMIVK